jgi:hypothetical protein
MREEKEKDAVKATLMDSIGRAGRHPRFILKGP